MGPLGRYGPGPCGLGPYEAPWALVGRALMGRALWALLGSYGVGPYGHPWILMGRALTGQAIMGPLCPHGPARLGQAIMGWALMAPLGIFFFLFPPVPSCRAVNVLSTCIHIYMYVYIKNPSIGLPYKGPQ